MSNKNAQEARYHESANDMCSHFIMVIPTHIAEKGSAPSFREREETQRFYTETLLHTEAFTHRHFCTQELFTHRHFHTHRHFYTETFTHRRFHTQTLLHTNTFHAQRLLHTQAFTHRSFYTQTLSHTETGPVKSQFDFSFWRSNLISRVRVAIDTSKSQFYFSF